MLAVSLLQLIFPFLTQSLVDVGIRDGNLGFITLILTAQLVVSVSRLSVEFIRSWILLHMNTCINISLISDFLIKLMKLPLRFFDTRMIGDIMQRIGDHNRIENFLTGSSVATLFSFVNFFIFGWILACYNPVILGIFLAGNTLYVCWVLVFMKYRRELDIRRFAQAAGEQSSLIQIRATKEVDTVYPNFSKHLYELSPKLSVIELQICYLMKISIPPTHIAIFTNRTKAAISNARTRLAKRLLGEQNSTEKLDAFISDLQ